MASHFLSARNATAIRGGKTTS